MSMIIDMHRVEPYSWEEVEKMVRMIVEKINKSGFYPTAIGAIPRGGWVVAALLAQRLNVKRTISVDIVKNNNVCEVYVSSLSKNIFEDRILLVEDSMETGGSIFAASQVLSSEGAKDVRTAALLINQKCTTLPNYFLQAVGNIAAFPWDK